MNNWLTAGTKIGAVAANNDEMAIGAIMLVRRDNYKSFLNR